MPEKSTIPIQNSDDMDYIGLIEDTIKYIEENLEEALTLDALSKRFYVSKCFFHRIFSAVMGCSLKRYINQRRLNKALEYVMETSDTIADIAYRLQFSSQVSFTRAFKNFYGMPPSQVRKESIELIPEPIPNVLKRPMKNFNSDVVAEFTIVEEEALTLIGFYMDVDLSDLNIQQKVNCKAEAFLESIRPKDKYNAYAVYLGASDENKSDCIRTFFGIDLKPQKQAADWPIYKIPNMLYAKFRYTGDLLHIGDLVVRDLARWLTIAKIKRQETEIKFMQAYDKVYKENASSNIYLPISEIPQRM